MSSTRRSLAKAFIRLSIKIAPRQREIWFEAMALELDHVRDAGLPRFATGCLMAALRARIASPSFILGSAHLALVVGATGWAAMNLWFAGRMANANVLPLELFAYCVAAAFAFGALVTARFGFKATIGLGAPMMLMLAVAALAVKLMLPQSSTTAVYFALVVEDISVLLVALLIAFSAPRIVAATQAPGR